MAVVELSATHTKAAVSHQSMRPAVAVIDPLNTMSCPPDVTASSGYDAVVQALESLTCLSVADRPPALSPEQRPVYVGYNPISRLWCEEAVIEAGRFLRRAVQDGADLEARTGMSLAALCSRLGNAGVHLPHATAYAVVGAAGDYRPRGFSVDRPLVPHGQSVVVTAPAAFEFTYPGAPERHLRAAELVGVSAEERGDAPRTALSNWLRDLLAATGGPQSLSHFGITRADVGDMVDRTMDQQRILVCSPREVTEEAVTTILERSMDPVS
jgi:alcohol dehydrogenase class IV